MATLTEELHEWLDHSRERVARLPIEPRLEQIGHVMQVGDGVATVRGLPGNPSRRVARF